ncbi:MAG: DUF3341 domain-containing protein [Planctomycetota bacterium]
MAISDYFPFVPKQPPRFVTPAGAPISGIIARFKDPASVYHAAETMRDAGYKKFDVMSPFPIHGIDEAMGVPRSILPLMVAGGGFTGAAFGFLLQYWTTAVDYPLMVQGKPMGAWEPFLMVMFELGVLFASFTALFGMLALNGLPRFSHPLFSRERFLSVSDDAFFIAVESEDKRFDPDRLKRELETAGGVDIELVEDDA